MSDKKQLDLQKGYKRVNVNIREDLFKKVKIQSVHEDLKIGQMLEKLIEREFNNSKYKVKK
jgi:hypothetical protein